MRTDWDGAVPVEVSLDHRMKGQLGASIITFFFHFEVSCVRNLRMLQFFYVTISQCAGARIPHHSSHSSLSRYTPDQPSTQNRGGKEPLTIL